MRIHLGVILLLAACSNHDDLKKQAAEEAAKENAKEEAMKPSEPAKPPPPPPKKLKTPDELGKCELKVTGGVTAEITQIGGKEAVNVAYWFKPEERKNMMGVDGFVINCSAPGARFSILPAGGSPDGMPFKPKKYEFKKGAKPTGANVMATFGQATLSDPVGFVDVTAFDSSHIAGTVDISGKIVPGNKPVKITGSFDLGCPNYSACDE
ncbi:MAG: hypothetical protein AB7O24_02760 [Kofleriaceae bacterium]